MNSKFKFVPASILFALIISVSAEKVPDIDDFFQAAAPDSEAAREALDRIAPDWNNSYSGLIIDLARFMRPQNNDHPSASIRKRLLDFLAEQTGQKFKDDLTQWRHWNWSLPYEPHPEILYFKSHLYSIIDQKMTAFFPPGAVSKIRLDEIDWGGVGVNGIPPLDHIPVLKAGEADYLGKNDIIFGITVSGEARAYPKRIIAWHEMVLDSLGGKDITLVYCTLCGAAIPYDSLCGGLKRQFGTSGLLYRSNKLMFDARTNSLWSALTGEPVVGRLVDSGLRLDVYPIVTTTWEEWKKLHPETTVLSLQTGHERDYSEGAAYKDYFATDRLMFSVSSTDNRLSNKAVVLVIRLPGTKPLAIHTDFLKKNPLFQQAIEGLNLVVVSSRGGAQRVYNAGQVEFLKKSAEDRIVDSRQRTWMVREKYLQLSEDETVTLARIPAHQAFWFGWYAQFPETELIK